MIIATDENRPDYQNTFFYYFDETHNSKIQEPYVYHGQITPDYSTGWSHVSIRYYNFKNKVARSLKRSSYNK